MKRMTVLRWMAAASVVLVAVAVLAAAEDGTDASASGMLDPLLTEGYAPQRVETATFALGCFWGPDARLGMLRGVLRTRVGYSGGTTLHPSYYDIDGHAESVQVDFDPSIISYARLLEAFWAAHDPLREPRTPQYRSVIFYHSEEQRAAAEASALAHEEDRGAPPHTEIVPFERFTRAEDFHQKYWLLGSDLVYEMQDRFGSFREFVDSTVAARLNGYVAGWGTVDRLEAELEALALSEDGETYLRDLYR